MATRTLSATSVNAPPLPPRQTGGSSSRSLSPYRDAPPPYSLTEMQSSGSWAADDPRSSSTQSLVPTESNVQNERRKLLLIYIHGFMGDETSFRSFPAHVHNLLTVLLTETHVVHTKVYPRYRSRRNITFARDDFSKWLEPHEKSSTDIILLGHSMGGLLSAEVAVMHPPAPADRPLKHDILGTINFDVPFLGMHPGVVKSGLAIVFHSSEETGDQWSDTDSMSYTNENQSSSTLASERSTPSRHDTFWNQPRSDPNLNPSFANDVILPMRTGWRNALHFVHKHSGNLGELTKATKKLVSSHLEFGGAMANYPELRTRYYRIRALEEADPAHRKRLSGITTETPRRVRFVNYYTASTGHVKKEKRASSSRHRLSPNASASQSRASLSSSITDESRTGNSVVLLPVLLSSSITDESRTGRSTTELPESIRSRSPRISLEEHSDAGIVRKNPEIPSSEDEDWETAAESLVIDDRSIGECQHGEASHSPTRTTESTTDSPSPLPELPSEPEPPGVSSIAGPDARKQAEKEHKRAVKAFDKAVQGRAKLEARGLVKAERCAEEIQHDSNTPDSAVKLSQPEQERLRLEQERIRMEQEARRLRGDALTPTQSSPSRSPSRTTSHSTTQSRADKREHKFCTLPKEVNGEPDHTWVRVFMENVDEVGAHCGLFFVDERYERLVGDVASRVEAWIKEDANRRFIDEANQLGTEAVD